MISRFKFAIYLCALALMTSAMGLAASHVYSMTNASAGNSVLDFVRNADGTLTLSATVPTGGLGSGKFLNASGPVTLYKTGAFLFVVNPGDNSVSSFKVGTSGLTLVSHISSGGTYPVSITSVLKKVYVLNQGGSVNNISGFNLNTTTGAITKLANSTQLLSAASVDPAQISFTNDGSALIVTEKATSLIDVFPTSGGLAQAPTTYAASSNVPYGFTFDTAGRFYMTYGFFSGLSSYSLVSDVPTVITPYVKDNAGASCWVVLNAKQNFAYVVDNGNGAKLGGIAVYRVNPSGQISLDGALRQQFGPGGADIAITKDGANVYYTVIGGAINEFTANADGSLTPLPSLTGLVSTIEGLAAN